MAVRLRLYAAATAGVVVIAGFAGLAGAAKGAAGGGVVTPGIRTAIPLVAGEDPFLIAGSTATARWTGKVLRLDVAGLDALRFPVTVKNFNRVVVSPCVTAMRIGNLSGAGTLIADPLIGGANNLGISGAGPGAVGDVATADITCDWTDRKGVVQHHEAHFAGQL